MQFKIDLQVKPVKAAINAVLKELKNPDDMLNSVGETLLRANQDRHFAGLDPKGNKWAPLKPSTLAQGKRKGGPLNKTSEMLNSLNYQVSGNELVLGFDGERNNMLANIHHGGTEPYLIKPLTKKALAFNGIVRKKVNHPGLPARELLGFEEDDQELVVEVAEDHLAAILSDFN